MFHVYFHVFSGSVPVSGNNTNVLAIAITEGEMYSLVGSQCTAGWSGSCGLWSLCQKIEDFIGDLKAAVIGDGLEAVVDSKEHPPNWTMRWLKTASVKLDLFPLTSLWPDWNSARSHARATVYSSREDTRLLKLPVGVMWRRPPERMPMFSKWPRAFFCRVSNAAFRSSHRRHTSS